MCGTMVTDPLQAMSVALKMADITAFGSFWSTALAILISGKTNKNFIKRITTFSFLNLHLSFDCKFPMKKFYGA